MPQPATPTAACRTEIVVPTLAEMKRGPQLLRALDSILTQGARPLVVINGTRFDPDLRVRLERMPEIRVIYLAQPGLPNAIHVGRGLVEADFFGFLDDDDYLLPGSIALREGLLASRPEVDVVVANGRREEWGEDAHLYDSVEDVKRIAADPLAALLRANWMTPCGALYRNANIPVDLFLDLSKYSEWTDVAFRLIGRHALLFRFEDTFVQTDTPGSLSKQFGQASHALELHQKMAGGLRDPVHLALWNLRMSQLHHAIAMDELASGHRAGAWRHHLKSILHAPRIGVPRYLLYTLRFVWATARKAR